MRTASDGEADDDPLTRGDGGSHPTRFQSIVALLVGVAALLVGQGMLTTLVGLRLDLAEHPSWVIGAVMTAYFAGVAWGAVATPGIVERVGHIRTFSALAAAGAGVAIGHGLIDGPVAWGVLRLAGGFVFAGLLVVVESWLGGRATQATRGAVLAAYMTTYYVALGAGQFLLGAFDPRDGRLFAIAALFFCASVLPIALARHEAPVAPEPTYLGPRAVFRRAPLAVVGTTAAGVILGAFYALGPVYARGVGFTASGAARFMGAGILGGLLLQVPLGRLSDRIGRRPVLGGAGLALVPVCLLLAWPDRAPDAAAVALVIAFGAIAMVVYPISLAYGGDWFEDRERTSASGTLVLASAIGSACGPLLASACMDGLGPGGLFALIGGIAALFALYTVRRVFARPPRSAEERETFVVVPRTTAVVVELDERSADDGRTP